VEPFGVHTDRGQIQEVLFIEISFHVLSFFWWGGAVLNFGNLALWRQFYSYS